MSSSHVLTKVGRNVQRPANGAGLYGTPLPRIGPPANIAPDASQSDKKIFEMRVDKLREAIRSEQVSFPSQIPTFSKHTRPDLQRKLVQLYFVCGWSAPKIRERYGLGEQRFQQIVSAWKNRAIELGYIQAIPPDPRRTMISLRRPIRVVLSPAAPSDTGLPVVRRVHSGKHGDTKKANGTRGEIGRPRRKCDSNRISELLEDLRAGRAAADVADEGGVSVSTVRVWKKEQEMRLLRRENKELKDLLAKVGALEKTGRLH